MLYGAVAVQVDAKMRTPHSCNCGDCVASMQVDSNETRVQWCVNAWLWSMRHHAADDLIKGALVSANVPADRRHFAETLSSPWTDRVSCWIILPVQVHVG